MAAGSTSRRRVSLTAAVVAWLALASTVAGLSAAPLDTTVGPLPAAQAIVAIPARGWLDTGMTVEAGQVVSISASGDWNPGDPEQGLIGPDGSTIAWPDNFLNLDEIGVCASCAKVPTPHWAALVGYVGSAPPSPGSYAGSMDVLPEARKVFVAGSRSATVSSTPGTLWLAMNDDAYSGYTADNVSDVTATIELIRPAVLGTGVWHGGETVTLHGAGFGAATRVAFGGIDATSVTSVDADTLRIVVPSRAHPTVDVEAVPVVVDPAGSNVVAGVYRYRGAAVFMIRGLLSHLPEKATDWTKGEGDTDTFYQPNGLAGSLLGAGWPAKSLLDYSYTGGSVDANGAWTPKGYLREESFPSFVSGSGSSVGRLDTEIRTYLAMHPEIDVYLVGHSQGGVVALTYLAYRRARGATDGTIVSGSSTGHLAAVATMDSPIGGLDSALAVSWVCGLVATLAWDPALRDLCRTALDGNIAASFPDLVDFQGIKDSASGDPWGATRMVTALTDPASSRTVNQALARAASRSPGTAVLTIGNRKDGAIAIGTLGQSVSTQWLRNEAAGPFAMILDSTTCGRFYGLGRGLACAIKDHNVVMVDPAARRAVVDLFAGRVPYSSGMAIPTALAPAPPTFPISGTVAALGAGAGAISVVAIPYGTGGNSATTTAATDGTYRLEVPAGLYVIGFIDPTGTNAPGYWAETGFVALASEATIVSIDDLGVSGLDVSLRPARTISGVVQTAAGLPVGGMGVILLGNSDGEIANLAQTADDGSWSAVVPSGSYLVRIVDADGVYPAGYLGSTGTVASIADASTVTVGASGADGLRLVTTPDGGGGGGGGVGGGPVPGGDGGGVPGGDAPVRYAVSATPSAPVAGTVVTVTAQLVDGGGSPVPTAGVKLAWSASPRGGVLSATTGTTDASGRTTVLYTVGSAVGSSFSVTATDVAGLSGTSPQLRAVAPPAGARAASRLGTGTSGSYTVAGKTATRGRFITWRLSLGRAYGRTRVTLWTRLRLADGTWGPSVRYGLRTTSAAGDAYLSLRFSTPRSVLVYATAGAIGTSSAVGSWR